MEKRVELTADERAAILPSLQKIVALREQMQEIVQTIEPFIVLIAKQKGLEPTLYQISEDGAALILRQVTETA